MIDEHMMNSFKSITYIHSSKKKNYEEITFLVEFYISSETFDEFSKIPIIFLSYNSY